MLHSRIARKFDYYVIDHLRAMELPLARFALFVIFFWFGALKLFDKSPANPLADLLHKTLPFVSFNHPLFFGLLEMAVGIVPVAQDGARVAIALLLPHMVTTFLPLVLLAPITWQAPFVPTLEGQYIIKNLVIIALACTVAARIRPWRK